MIKNHRLMLIKKIIFFIITFNCFSSFSQINNNILIKLGYPLPVSKIQFSEYYNGIANTEIDYSIKLTKHYSAGFGLQFSYFQFIQYYDFPFTTSIYTPNINFSYSINIKTIQLEPIISLGYSIFNHHNHGYMNKDTVIWYKNFEISPGINILFFNKGRLKFGFNTDYSIIFESFYGKQSHPLNENGDMDDKTTRYVSFNILVQKCF